MKWLFGVLLLLLSPVFAEEVQFKVGDDTLYATFLAPANTTGKVPAVLLLSGSGPTDRDGNSGLLVGKIDSHKHLAEVLAAHGVATLRYDKLFSGQTGPATHAGNYTQIGIDTYVSEAQAAYQVLAQRPEVDPLRMAILGHSEGGLIALLVAHQVHPPGLKGLILAMPMCEPYLVTIRSQVASQYAAAVASGACPQSVADEDMAMLDKVVGELQTTGGAPSRAKLRDSLQVLFAPANDYFLFTASQHDAAKLAHDLDLPMLLYSGTRDIQITAPMIAKMKTALAHNPRAQVVELQNVNHVLKVVTEGSVADYTDPKLPFSPDLDRTLGDWVKANL